MATSAVAAEWNLWQPPAGKQVLETRTAWERVFPNEWNRWRSRECLGQGVQPRRVWGSEGGSNDGACGTSWVNVAIRKLPHTSPRTDSN